MAIKMSTGLRNQLLDANPFKTIFENGYLHIFGGTVPASPNDNINSGTTLLATIYSDGGTADAGLEFEASASGGVLEKASGETWDNNDAGNIASGTATFYVFTASGESDGTSLGASTSAARFMGTIATSGADLNLSTTSLTSGNTQTINAFSVSIPESI